MPSASLLSDSSMTLCCRAASLSEVTQDVAHDVGDFVIKRIDGMASYQLAVMNADKLLDRALKDSRYKGKTMGERLVAAQREIKYNDDVWYGHKLRNKLVHENDIKLKERDVKDALLGIKAALKDLGAL